VIDVVRIPCVCSRCTDSVLLDFGRMHMAADSFQSGDTFFAARMTTHFRVVLMAGFLNSCTIPRGRAAFGDDLYYDRYGMPLICSIQ